MRVLLLFMILCAFLYSQNRLNGTVSLESQYVNYDEKSALWTDSNFQQTKNSLGSEVDNVTLDLSQYSSSYLIPGFRNSLNLSLFNFTPTYKASLYARVQTSEWTQPDRLKHIDRVSLNLNFGNNRIVLGDHYLNSNKLFIDQRQLRGAFAQFTLLGGVNEANHLRVNAFGGFIEFENRIGDPVVGRYRSYYRVNRFNRSLTGGEVVGSFFNKLIEFRLS
ncbi:MAG: hypothetical protein KDD94_12065, partial [Calditrichaeota bacterium]|nr:hypothetical protein [Calditrichota bacterium]